MSSTISPPGFHHDAFLYAGDGEFVEGALAFIREGIDAHEPTFVMVSAAKIELLREALDGDGEGVHFADMSEVGANPARIIPAWHEFVREHTGPRVALRGISEPVWAGRTPAELVECHRHESLLNLAFAEAGALALLCAYDTEALDPAEIDEARCTHPFLHEDGVASESRSYRGIAAFAAPFEEPLPEPATGAREIPFDLGTLPFVRSSIREHATDAGLRADRTSDLVLAVHELATNSVRHGGGAGVLRLWPENGSLICEIRDRGRIEPPLAGREPPVAGQEGGYGLWLVNQLCDLVQVRSATTGNVVRLHMRRAA